MRTLALIFDAAAFLGALVFVVYYSVGTRTWYRSQIGRSIMALSGVLAALLGLLLVQLAWRPPLMVWVLVLGGLAAVLWWRVWILWRFQHPRTKETVTPARGSRSP